MPWDGIPLAPQIWVSFHLRLFSSFSLRLQGVVLSPACPRPNDLSRWCFPVSVLTVPHTPSSSRETCISNGTVVASASLAESTWEIPPVPFSFPRPSEISTRPPLFLFFGYLKWFQTGIVMPVFSCNVRVSSSHKTLRRPFVFHCHPTAINPRRLREMHLD